VTAPAKRRWTTPTPEALRLHFHLWLAQAHARRQPRRPAATAVEPAPEVVEAPPRRRRKKRKQT
jgi:hypothetical protein